MGRNRTTNRRTNQKWKSEDEDLQEEVLDEVEFELANDKALEDSDFPELIGRRIIWQNL